MKYGLAFTELFDDIKNVHDIQAIGHSEVIFFGRGSKDDWCAYVGVMLSDGRMHCAFPNDKYYYELAETLAAKYGLDAVYDDIKHLYEHAGKNIDQRLVDEIHTMSFRYGLDRQDALNMFMHLYYGMVAEENDIYTKLGKSVKMHGIHSLLKCGRGADVAASECRGVAWQVTQASCIERHIYRTVIDK